MSEWTVDTLKQYNDALRAADQRALQIKETADEKALDLSAEVQRYKDEKANELRSQIEREQGERATKIELQALGEKLEATIKPLSDYVHSQQGRSSGTSALVAWGFAAVTVLVSLAAVIATLLTH